MTTHILSIGDKFVATLSPEHDAEAELIQLLLSPKSCSMYLGTAAVHADCQRPCIVIEVAKNVATIPAP